MESREYVTKDKMALHRQRKTVVVERELEKMAAAGEKISAVALVAAATATNHPLHRYFEWDNSEAAKKYRLAQATSMILATRFVVVLKEQRDGLPQAVGTAGKNHSVRKLLPAFDGEHGYRQREDVLGDPPARAAIIERKKAVLRSWCRETIDIDELSHLRELIEQEMGR